MMVEPWATFYDVDDDGWGPAGVVRAARRAEAVERARERREAEERAERVEARRNHAVLAAQWDAVSRGIQWDPLHPFATWPSVEEFCARVENAQDREAAAQERRALREAGMIHYLDRPDEIVTPPAPVSPTASRNNPLRRRVRAALVRWRRGDSGEIRRSAALRRSSGCRCAACDPDALRSASEPAEITRYVDGGMRIR